MCELCNDIKTLVYDKRYGYHPLENSSQIVKDEDGNFHIWEDGGGDVFMAGVDEKFTNIVYCPKCGRKLTEGTDEKD